MPGPLDGIRIVEMSVAVTGPLAVTLLVDQGAEAIKVEEPGFGDQGRYVGVASGGISALFQMCNRGKRSVAVDCTHPKGRDIVLDLAAGADVFVQNMRPGVVERLGLGYDDVSTRNPGVVYASLSGFGPDGPYAHRRVYDSVIQAQAGLVGNQTGINDASPRFLRQAAADKITAYTAAQAITAALLARERGAGGQHVQLAMLDASVAFLFADAAAHEVALDNDQRHLAQSFSAYQRAIALADGHMVVAAVTDGEFHGMAKAFGVDSTDPRVAGMGDRQRHKEQTSAVFRAVHAAAAAMPLADAVEALDRHQVPFGVVLDVEDVAGDAQAVHNQLFTEHDHPVMGRVRQPRPAARFSATPAELRQPSSPVHGQHTDEVLRELGLTGSIDQLRADRVIR
ncbi:MAG: CoA transferase [Acidimicrobiaceae bacterium]|nr:CoA transferase [Acidimicrobiaceae bacterium]MXZ97844.1 CoA transferase [Acidimicrobiaceae bacterium]MYE77331.1 CoA transferase [Acidimicrobiaceae bacterium]MYE97237.1 CoA transferase [Acidimicrobiaceae bacterium]MYH44957.1 CoA transferase [Acidimicrobiaceae bacterium]